MDIDFLIKGLIIGFSIAVPVGPIGVLCIQRSLNKGQLSGLFTGLGAATADAIYGLVAGFGLTLVSSFLIAQKLWIQLLGAAFLIYLGIKMLREKPATKAKAAPRHSGLLMDYVTTIGLTLTNPMTILSFVAVFAGLGLVNTGGNYLTAMMLVIGVFLGSALWWLILSGSVALLGRKLDQRILGFANKLAGIIMLVFSVVILFGVMFPTA